MRHNRSAVALVVIAQWLGTSLWFSPSGAAEGLMAQLGIDAAAFGWLIAATQLGFIGGTLGLAATGGADRFSASRIFALSCMVGAVANAALVVPGAGYSAVWALRFGVGLCLAGIYPLGMKMIVQWVGGKPAAALGWLVGMLTLGTAMPHGLRAVGASWSWATVVLASSMLAVLGAVAIYLLGDGPHGTPPRRSDSPIAARQAVRNAFALPAFRATAFGYFGHMWELYAFWSVLPLLCQPIAAELAGRSGESGAPVLVALISFSVIAMGSIGCVAGGQLSRHVGSAPVAAAALAGSGLMCVAYPLIPDQTVWLRIGALLFWGFCVVADSPQFSALAAEHAPPQQLGSALVVQNGIGFLITVVSILIMSRAVPSWGAHAAWILVPGPILGLVALRPLLRRESRDPSV